MGGSPFVVLTGEFFTCIGQGHGAPVFPATKEKWLALGEAPWLAEMCRRILAGEEWLKHKLPVWTPMCAEFKDNHRCLVDAVLPLKRFMVDVDEKGHSLEILKRALDLHQSGRWNILLVERSVREGTHVLVSLPDGMTAAEAQEAFSRDIGFPADKSVKDVSRCIYMVPSTHTLWVNEERLFHITEEETLPLTPPQGSGVDSNFSRGISFSREQSISRPPQREGWGESSSCYSSSLPHREGWGESPFGAGIILDMESYLLHRPDLALNLRTEGSRNDSALKLACAFSHRFADVDELAQTLALFSPLSAQELKSIAKSAWKYRKQL